MSVNLYLLATLFVSGLGGIVYPRVGFACLVLYLAYDFMAGRLT